MSGRIGGAVLTLAAAALLVFAVTTSWWSGHPHDRSGEELQRQQADIGLLNVHTCLGSSRSLVDLGGSGTTGTRDATPDDGDDDVSCKKRGHFEKYTSFAIAGVITLGAAGISALLLALAAGLGLAGKQRGRKGLAIAAPLAGAVAIVASIIFRADRPTSYSVDETSAQYFLFGGVGASVLWLVWSLMPPREPRPARVKEPKPPKVKEPKPPKLKAPKAAKPAKVKAPKSPVLDAPGQNLQPIDFLALIDEGGGDVRPSAPPPPHQPYPWEPPQPPRPTAAPSPSLPGPAGVLGNMSIGGPPPPAPQPPMFASAPGLRPLYEQPGAGPPTAIPLPPLMPPSPIAGASPPMGQPMPPPMTPPVSPPLAQPPIGQPPRPMPVPYATPSAPTMAINVPPNAAPAYASPPGAPSAPTMAIAAQRPDGPPIPFRGNNPSQPPPLGAVPTPPPPPPSPLAVPMPPPGTAPPVAGWLPPRGRAARPDQPTIMPAPSEVETDEARRPSPQVGDRTDPAMMAAPPPDVGDRTDPNQAALESGPIGLPIDSPRAHDRPDTAQETIERRREELDVEQTTRREKTPSEQPAVMSTASPDLPAPTTAQLSADGPAPACPQCESPMSWVDKHLRFYCSSCRMYF